MPVTFIDDLPGLSDSDFAPSMRVRGATAFLRTPHFIARICLNSGKVVWFIERSFARLAKSAISLPRRIRLSGSDLWASETEQIVAEILCTENGELTVSARNAETGEQVWEHFIPIPEAADWAERTPAWPGAQTEEIDAFIADDPNRLIVCLFRQSRRSTYFSPSHEVGTLPSYSCQTDAVGFIPSTGKVVWRSDFENVRVGILERESFTGFWSHSPRVGKIDFDTGTNGTLYESSNSLGWPARVGSLVAVPWHSKREVGVDWIDQRGERIRKGTFRRLGAVTTNLHVTESGLALQTNDQMLWWLGKEELPLWSIRAKPYIYRVHSSRDSSVFVGTDGNGGRLMGFDQLSGGETLNLKPALGGVGDLSKVPGHDVSVATFMTSRS